MCSHLPDASTMDARSVASHSSRISRHTKKSHFGGSDVLQKKVHKSSKYAGVEGVVDSGRNVLKVKNITTREYLKRKGELFKRVKPTSLYRLVADHEEEPESIYEIGARGGAGEGGFAELSAATAYDERKTGGAGGAGAGTHIVTHDASEVVKEVEKKPYLVLDVREIEEFEECHLYEAVSYPAPRISQDRITPQLFSYKNKDGKMIIVYSNEEKVAAGVATTFVQKGWDNVYMLSGGLKKTAEMYPLIVEGELPEALYPSPKSSRVSSRMSSAGSVRGSSRRGRSSAGSVAASSPKTARSFATSKASAGWR